MALTDYDHLLAFGIRLLNVQPQAARAALDKLGASLPKPVIFTVAVDLDGTLAEKEEPFSSKSIGKLRPKARQALARLRQAGCRSIIFTVRGQTSLVKAWLDKHKLDYDYINENPDQPEDASGKIIADAYLDDRAIYAEDIGAAVTEALRWQRANTEKAKQAAIERQSS